MCKGHYDEKAESLGNTKENTIHVDTREAKFVHAGSHAVEEHI